MSSISNVPSTFYSRLPSVNLANAKSALASFADLPLVQKISSVASKMWSGVVAFVKAIPGYGYFSALPWQAKAAVGSLVALLALLGIRASKNSRTQAQEVLIPDSSSLKVNPLKGGGVGITLETTKPPATEPQPSASTTFVALEDANS